MGLHSRHKGPHKKSVRLKSSTSSDSELLSGTKERKYTNPKKIEYYKIGFLFFHFIICAICCVIIVYILESIRSPHEVSIPKVTTVIPKAIPPLPASCPHLPFQVRSLYGENFSFDLHALLRENETGLDQESEILWTKRGLTYGDLQSVYRFTTNISISEVSGHPLRPNRYSGMFL